MTSKRFTRKYNGGRKDFHGIMFQEGFHPDLESLSDVNFSDASMSSAYFSDKTLKNIFLSEAAVTKSCFSNAQLYGVDFEGATVTKSYFGHAQLYGVNFSYANLNDCDFSHASLENVDFDGAELAGAAFIRTDMSGVKNLDKANGLDYILLLDTIVGDEQEEILREMLDNKRLNFNTVSN